MQFNLGSPVQQFHMQGSHLGIERFAPGQKRAPSDPAQLPVCDGTVPWKCRGKVQGGALTFGNLDLTGAYYLRVSGNSCSQVQSRISKPWPSCSDVI